MFKKLRNRIIIITMTVTTAVLVLAGGMIMLFSSATRPEPKPQVGNGVVVEELNNGWELEDYIRDDRREGNERLLVTLLCTGAVIEVAAFLIVYYASRKVVEPVEDAYDKQKIFIANASHELKTPLAVIQANMEAMEVDAENERWKTNVENELANANKLVLDLLQLARMDAGSSGEATSEEVDLAAEIKNRVETFRPKFAGKIIYESSVKSVKRNLPKREFVQVLDILLDNATKYGKKKIIVTLDKGELSVVNDGAVIKSADADKVFERFYQVDKAREGAGLGLAIAKAVCEKNGWRIRCEGGGKQTKFVVEW